MENGKKDQSDSWDDEIGIVFLVILSIVVIAPVALWKCVESDPASFESITMKESVKGAGVAFSFALGLVLAMKFYPELAQETLVSLGKMRIHASVLLSWLIGNLVLGGSAYLTLPLWKGSLRKKALKEKLY